MLIMRVVENLRLITWIFSRSSGIIERPMSIESYQNKIYRVVAYSPDWEKMFSAEASVLKAVFGDAALGIEHIGSTAVPGMQAKPVLDILVLVEDINAADRFIEPMQQAGYVYAGEYVMPRSRLYRKVSGGEIIANIHVFPKDHHHVQSMLGVREYLLHHPDEVERYSELKKELYVKYPNDYGEYRRQKDLFLSELIAKLDI